METVKLLAAHMNAHSHFRFSFAQIFTSHFAALHFDHIKRAEGNVFGSFAEHLSPVVPREGQGTGRDAEFEEPVAATFHRFYGISD